MELKGGESVNKNNGISLGNSTNGRAFGRFRHSFRRKPDTQILELFTEVWRI
jgi:hypothetical protein